MCSLHREAFAGTSSRPHTPQDAENTVSSYLEDLRSCLAERDKHDQSRFCDVRASDLFQDAVGTVRRIYERFHMEFTPEFEEAMQSWLAENRRHKRGKHVYTLEEFGLDAARLREAFRDYRSRFDID